MTERMKGTEGTSEARRPIRVMIRDEDLDDVKAHGYCIKGMAPTEEDVEGQIYILERPKPGEQLEDTEGQGNRISNLGQTEEDVEGQGFSSGHLRPAEPDEVEGQGIRGGFLVPEESDDATGQPWKYSFVPDDDTEGQGARYYGLGQTEDDTQGQGIGGRPPVDR